MAVNPFDLCEPTNCLIPILSIKNNSVFIISSGVFSLSTLISKLIKPLVMAVLLSALNTTLPSWYSVTNQTLDWQPFIKYSLQL